MPAVVVDQAALRDGEAAAAAEEARRRARAQASRSAKTMRARPGELGLPTDTKKRTGLWIGATLVVMLGIAGGAIFLLKAPAEPEAPPVSREATTVAPPSAPEPSIPVVPSPEALPVETAAAAVSAEPPAEAPPVKEPVEAAPVAKAPAKPNKPQPANRNNSAPKRASESRPSTSAEPKKTETQKKNVIVRDTSF